MATREEKIKKKMDSLKKRDETKAWINPKGVLIGAKRRKDGGFKANPGRFLSTEMKAINSKISKKRDQKVRGR